MPYELDLLWPLAYQENLFRGDEVYQTTVLPVSDSQRSASRRNILSFSSDLDLENAIPSDVVLFKSAISLRPINCVSAV